jgi:N-sulfoglucosamine sulfohydrolase
MNSTRREFLRLLGVGAAGFGLGCRAVDDETGKRRPNIVLILAEDIGPDLGCYGTPGLATPHLDRLASEGTLFRNCFCTSPVCSPSRSAMMTGMHQNAIGANQHRTKEKKPLPAGGRPFLHILRDAGYYRAIGCGHSAKTDLNFQTGNLFDGKNWKGRKEGQPFFAQITLANTHRSWSRDKERPIDPEKVAIPPYYPDTPFVRRDWANGLEEIQKMDGKVGAILARLEEEGLAKNTVVIFAGDNGRCHIRGKQFLYDGGIHVPLIVRRPDDARRPSDARHGTVCDDLVSAIDIPAAILVLAGCGIPAGMQGRDFLDRTAPRREYVFAARDKMDNTHDAMRAVRSKKFKYILNLMPERAWCQFNAYKEKQYPVLALMNVMHAEGTLTPAQDRFMATCKPEEELYDLAADPHEINNVTADPEYGEVLAAMRRELARWQKKVGDKGVSEEFRKGGWPASYPTRSLAEWKKIVTLWEGYLFEGKKHPRSVIDSGH